MSMTFSEAMTTKDARTENDMPTHSTSASALVDLFFSMGASRNKSKAEIERMFVRSFDEMPVETMKALFYNRDIRQGQGERRFFRTAFRYLCENRPETARKNLDLIPEYGRWDDVLRVAVDTPVETDSLDLYANALTNDQNGLAAKWAPREGKSDHDLFEILRDHMNLTHREYRKLVAGLSDTVEDKMTDRRWDEIDYDSVPSQAINNYRNAFCRNDEERFVEWVDDLQDEDSDAKVNAGAIYPHQIVRRFIGYGFGFGVNTINDDEARMLEAQWNSLPDYMDDGENQLIPVCDVSGSMQRIPMEVSISLGLYTSERNRGPFKDQVITFSDNPTFVELKSERLRDRIRELYGIDWGMNTDLEKTIQLVLNQAVKHDLPADQMPEMLVIFSDMQFDRCTENPDETAMEMMQRQYDEAGYEMPQIVFWNLRDSTGKPVKFTDSGVALVSGFSPSVIKQVLEGENLTPISIVMDVVNSERYDPVTV